MILPRNNEIVNLKIKEKYENIKHAGDEITMSATREKFWVLAGRKLLKAVIEKCMNCSRFNLFAYLRLIYSVSHQLFASR